MSARTSTAILTSGGLALDPSQLAIRLSDGRSVPLARLEMRLLRYLVLNAGHVLTRDEILRTVWGQDESESNMLDVYIGRLRCKLAAADAPAGIETVRSLGYRFRAALPLPAVAERAWISA